EQGQPVQLLPKNTPISILQIGQPQRVYNTLFQADSGSASSGEQFMDEALSAVRQNKLSAAEQAIRKALQLEPDSDEFLAALAEIQIKQNQLQHACDTYQKAVRRKPGQYELRTAQLLIRTGKRTEALRVLEDALLLDPQNAQAAYMIGTVQEETGNPKI